MIVTCKVCFKRFNLKIPHRFLSHAHQGQGPKDNEKRQLQPWAGLMQGVRTT